MYDRAKYDQFRSLEVPHVIALALSSDDSPTNQPEQSEPTMIESVSDLEGLPDLLTTVNKVNELLGALRAAGLMEE